MTDQAVDTGTRVPEAERTPSGEPPAPAPRSAPPPAFLGRTRELKELLADIERAGLNTIAGRKAPRARVLLVAGRPGSGRTALAGELVRRIAGRYPGGVLRARLGEPGGDPVPAGTAARRLLESLPGAGAPPGAGRDELAEALRDALASRRALLLLDDAKDAEQVDELVPDSPDCLVVAVSRGPLTGIPDVRPCVVGGLDARSAVQLLIRRIGPVRVTVDPCAAQELAEECHGEPATLLLAGGWLADRPEVAVADLVAQLRADPAADPLERMLGLVHDGLPAAVARMLRLFSLAPAGLVDPHTASALAGCSPQAAAEALERFEGMALLHRVPASEPLHEVPGCLHPLLADLAARLDRPAELRLARARMLERTVRVLHACRIAAETGEAARTRQQALPRALRFPGPEEAATWLDERRAALLAAARLAVADGELDTLARRLMAQLVRALVAHVGPEGAADDLYAVHGLVLDVAERRGLAREKAAALLNLADLDARTGRTAEALTRYRAALDAGRQAADPYAVGRAMESLGGAHQELGDLDRAADWYGRALAERLARDQRADAARLYGRIADAHARAGRPEEALRHWRAAFTEHRRGGDVPACARALGELARAQEDTGRREESLRTCREAVAWARRAGDERLEAGLHLRLAGTLERLGDPAAARLHRETAGRMLGDEPPPGRSPQR
ncbi:tetratricopeptide repeat protein [Streptomyces abyssomicinicus]|uniref:tetratricopeptide repeat protein n=1 Tax=Streptomyces abyssomicinicus TaxID=574929 RepID=UPI0012509465|nr:tetratricopeptide repeat protein [Streptomyces abyssomicinicus]